MIFQELPGVMVFRTAAAVRMAVHEMISQSLLLIVVLRVVPQRRIAEYRHEDDLVIKIEPHLLLLLHHGVARGRFTADGLRKV